MGVTSSFTTAIGQGGVEMPEVADLLAEGDPRLRRIGPMGLRLLAVAVGERRISRILRKIDAREPRAFVDRVVDLLHMRIDVRNEELLPDSPEIIVVSNHPTGGAEAIALLWVLLHRYGTARVPANELLHRLSPLRSIFVGVRVFGRQRAALRRPQDLLHPGKPLLIFPAGRTARVRSGVLREFAWQRGFLTLARVSGRPIVPVSVATEQSLLFRSVARLRRLLGCRINVEMFLLLREVVRKGREVTLIFHPPLLSDELPRTESAGEQAQYLKALVEAGYANR